MKTQKKSQMPEQSALLIPGFTLMGVGVGLFFFPQSVFGPPMLFAFIGCTLAGFALGLISTAMVSILQSKAGE